MNNQTKNKLISEIVPIFLIGTLTTVIVSVLISFNPGTVIGCFGGAVIAQFFIGPVIDTRWQIFDESSSDNKPNELDDNPLD